VGPKKKKERKRKRGRERRVMVTINVKGIIQNGVEMGDGGWKGEGERNTLEIWTA
jgi:hypothetical protein